MNFELSNFEIYATKLVLRLTGYKMIKVEADIIGVETGIINALIAKLGILLF